MDLRFVDHSGFHRAASAMVVLGAGLSAAALPLAGPLHVAPPLIGGALAVALGSGWAYGNWKSRGVLGALACVPVALSSTWGALIATAVIAGLAVAVGAENRKRALATVALGAGAVMLASWAGLRIHYAQETASWAPLVRATVSGAALGMIGVLSTLPRHVAWQLDAVLAAARKLPASLDREVSELCDRSLVLWNKSKEQLAGDATSTELLRSGVLKVLEVAKRTGEGSASLGAAAGSSERELAERIADLERRIEAASDAETKAQYAAAREGLEDQRKYRERLRAGRERMVARLHNHVAALEKFHLAAVSLDASKQLAADEPMVKQLADLSSEVSASGEALVEAAS